MERAYRDSFDPGEVYHLKDANLVAELRAFLYFLGRKLPSGNSTFSRYVSFYAKNKIAAVLARLSEPEVRKWTWWVLSSFS